MANWGRILSRGHVEDRRSFGPMAAGGISLSTLALYALFTYFSGGSLGDVLQQLPPIDMGQQNYVTTQEYEGEDSYEVFASTVLGSNNDMWRQLFAAEGKTYTEPRLVLFRTATQSSCGGADSQVGPHYCPLDQSIYLDETFFDELRSRFGAQGGDVAEAYVLSHEVAHHAQNELGIMDEVHATYGNDNSASIKMELQADCFAGLWANSIKDQGVLEFGEIREAMDAASAVGDDRIQKSITGRTSPETWTHGSSDQRVAWFSKGYESGDLTSCNTFN